MDKRAVGDWIVKRKPRFQTRPGQRKPTGKHQGSTGDVVSENEAGGIVALTAKTQEILGQAQRQIELAAVRMIARQLIGNLNELRGGTQLLPQPPCPGVSMARFRRGEALNGLQDCTHSDA